MYIYIFDYSFGRIYEIETDASTIIKNYNNDFDNFFKNEYGLNIHNITYMTSNQKLEIEKITSIN